MLKEELFAAWAPPESIWSPWAKPVLFAHVQAPPSGPPESNWQTIETAWAPEAAARVAVVVDLPGPLAVAHGVALARRGFRPVPLFNGCPGVRPAVSMESLMAALVMSADDLATLPLPPDAPPAFLLDSGRNPKGMKVPPGDFDNRWLTFPQDFPSANLLRSHGIGGVLLVQSEFTSPADDLAHVLLRWQQAGLPLEMCCAAAAERQALSVRQPPFFRALWYHALTVLGLRRNSAGGFGSIVPQPQSSGGSGYRGFG